MKITRKQFLKLGAGAAAAGLGGGLSGILRAQRAPGLIAKTRPNILMIMTDQERSWNDLPANLDIPNRRRVAEKGTYFNAYHINAIACGPSRAASYTGQHIQRSRVYDNPTNTGGVDLDPKLTPTIPRMLKDQGYHTVYKGKWHLSLVNKLGLADNRAALRPFGIDEYHKTGDTFGATHGGFHLDPLIAADAERWLRGKSTDLAREKPWFLAVNLINPHDIMFFDATGRQKETRLVPGYISALKSHPDTAIYRADLGHDLPPSFPDDISTKPEVHRAYVEDADHVYGLLPHDDREAWRRYQNYYFNCIRDVDRHVGTVLDALEATGQTENTIVVITGDHGELASAHGHRLKGPFVYRENVQVPLAITHPDLAGGQETDALACSIDLAPTLLSMAGLDDGARAERYPGLKGYDLSSSLINPKAAGSRGQGAGAILLNYSAVFPTNPRMKRQNLLALKQSGKGGEVAKLKFPVDTVQFELRSFYRGLYDGRYRFARYFRPGEHHTPQDWATLTGHNDIELYDTTADPDCMTNLGHAPEAHKALILELNARLNKLIADEVGLDDGSHMPGDPQTWRLS